MSPTPPTSPPHLGAALSRRQLQALDSQGKRPRGLKLRASVFEYPGHPGTGHLLHTYVCDGTPIPSFAGEPKRVALPGDIDALTDTVWNSLNPDNKVSLFVRFTNLETRRFEQRLRNKNLEKGAVL